MHTPTSKALFRPLFTTLLLPSTALAVSLTTLSPRDTPAALPRVASISYSGNGCPSSAPEVDKLGSWSDLAFQMNAFDAQIPGGTTSSTNCEVHVQAIGCSAGWQVGVKDVYVKGHLVLDPGAELDYYVTSFWSEDAGADVTVSGSVPNTGMTRLDEDVTAHTSIPEDQVVWSQCSGTDGALGLLNVNFRVALLADGDQYGYFGKDADTTATESYGSRSLLRHNLPPDRRPSPSSNATPSPSAACSGGGSTDPPPSTLPPAQFSLGRFGIPLNAAAVLYSIWAFLWSFWPQAYPATASGYKWASPIFGVTLAGSLVYFVVRTRHTYVGPVTEVEGRKLHAR
ncbi:Uu.00g053650.m01.CDS01 [Anthostomella pinea]|uniref:Uu.00g053650.m01.CDS01 n=1 Tax=Anthostomella pinea TaxID=933095 RepID=A0AAI8YPL1_9PEZI|nr:Uu.00g053650.m01.CDS01 [Anthostomella pinea]